MTSMIQPWPLIVMTKDRIGGMRLVGRLKSRRTLMILQSLVMKPHWSPLINLEMDGHPSIDKRIVKVDLSQMLYEAFLGSTQLQFSVKTLTNS